MVSIEFHSTDLKNSSLFAREVNGRVMTDRNGLAPMPSHHVHLATMGLRSTVVGTDARRLAQLPPLLPLGAWAPVSRLNQFSKYTFVSTTGQPKNRLPSGT